MPKEIKYAISQGGLRHDNHSAPAVLTQRNLNPKVNYILVRNTDRINSIGLSFDGTNMYTLRPGESLGLQVSGITKYWTVSLAGLVAVQVLTGAEI